MENLLRNYKYRTYESALFDLLDGSVYFSKPSEFHETNDRLEGVFEISTYKSLWNTIIQAYNVLERKRNSNIRIHTDIFSKSELDMISMSNEKFLEQSDKVGICSTSKNYDNQAMWVHYCKNRGVCFEFEWDKEIIKRFNLLIKEVQYSNKSRKFNRDALLKKMIINYGLENPNVSIKEILQWVEESSSKWIQAFVLESTCVKQECWSYENEIRLLSPSSGSLNILKRVLKSVYMFLPQFNSSDFKNELKKSRLMRLILEQLLDNYSNINLIGLSYTRTGKLIQEQISLL